MPRTAISETLLFVLDSENQTITNLRNEKITVTPAFPVDDPKSGRFRTALHWAGVFPKNKWDYRSKEAIPDIPEGRVVEVPNLFKEIQVVSLDYRNEGGRAYKIIINIGAKYPVLVDLRESTLLDIIANVGIGVNGIITSEFCWAIDYSQFKLIRVGSDGYKALVVAASREKSSLEIGGIYTTAQGLSTRMFLGHVMRGGSKQELWLELDYCPKEHSDVVAFMTHRLYGAVTFVKKSSARYRKYDLAENIQAMQRQVTGFDDVCKIIDEVVSNLRERVKQEKIKHPAPRDKWHYQHIQDTADVLTSFAVLRD